MATSEERSLASPEEHLDLARECLSRGDVSSLLSSLQDFGRDLRRLVVDGTATSVDSASSHSYDSSGSTRQSDGLERLSRARVDSLCHDVDEILAACVARQQETLDELTALRSQRQFQQSVAEDPGQWFKSQA